MTEVDLSPEELALAHDGERIVARAVASVEARAPHSLREEIERRRAAARPVRRRRLFVRGGGLAGAVAAAVVAVVLATGGDVLGDPSVEQVAAVARAAPTLPAPASDRAASSPGDPVLALAVDGVAFPDWEEGFAWTAVGARREERAGREVTTVSYRNADGLLAGYAIVAGDPLAAPPGRRVVLGGTTFTVAASGGRRTVSWVEGGRTCVLDAPDAVAEAKLLDLASSRVA
jgi:hypothetical protein